MTWGDLNRIALASALHDIGKSGIEEAILNKPEKLTQEEYEKMKKHTVIGWSMLQDLKQYQEEPLVRIAEQICRWHHRRVRTVQSVADRMSAGDKRRYPDSADEC